RVCFHACCSRSSGVGKIFSSRRRHQVIYEPIIHRQVRLRLYKTYSIHRAECRTGKERCVHAAQGRAFSTDYVHLVNVKKMKKLYPSGQAMPTRTGPSEPKQSSHDTSHERMTIKKERPVAASDGKRMRGGNKGLSVQSEDVNRLQRLKTFHKTLPSTLFLLSTISILLNFCLLNATHAQSHTHHSGGGAAPVVVDCTHLRKGIDVQEVEPLLVVQQMPDHFWERDYLVYSDG